MSSTSSALRSASLSLRCRGHILARVDLGATFWQRARGLIGHAPLAGGEGLLIAPCSSVHTFFMSFPIDVVYISTDLRVMKIVPRLRPWRFSAARGSRYVLELAAGAAEGSGLRPGDLLELAGSS